MEHGPVPGSIVVCVQMPPRAGHFVINSSSSNASIVAIEGHIEKNLALIEKKA